MLSNAGLGLGLPSTFAYTSEASRSCSTKTITAEDRDYLFPMPTKGRLVSAETIKVRDLVSYWSPNSEVEFSEEEAQPFQSESSPESCGLETPSDMGASPIQLAAHACLHLLSPKLEMLAASAAQQGLSAEEALSEAVEFAWLVPMVGLGKAPEPALVAPEMRTRPSLCSIASSVSSSAFESSSNDAAMARSYSTFSSASYSTSATSQASTSSASILDRKRPIASRVQGPPTTQLIKLKGSRSRLNLMEHLKSAESTPMKPTISSRSSISSVHSQAASLYSPSDSAIEVMLQPMDDLPSPCMSRTDRRPRYSPSPLSYAPFSDMDTRSALLQIWGAAEEADRSRRAALKEVKKSSSSHDLRTTASSKVSSWMQKVRKSASSVNLQKQAAAQPTATRMQDVEAWSAGQLPFDSCFEPRPAHAEIKRKQSIEQLLCPPATSVVDKALPSLPLPSREQSQDPVWTFLG